MPGPPLRLRKRGGARPQRAAGRHAPERGRAPETVAACPGFGELAWQDEALPLLESSDYWTEIVQTGYYGMNALSNNVIMADRKKLKSANILYLGSTGSGKSFAAKREL